MSQVFFSDTKEVENVHRIDIKRRKFVIHALLGENVPPGFFENCTNLQFVLGNVKTIGKRAFYNCTRLTSLDLSLVTQIGSMAFRRCTGLTSVDLPLVTQIKSGVFMNCTRLEKIDVPLATEIGEWAFDGCTGLTSVKLPSATQIGSEAFKHCTGLISIHLPSATEIGDGAFKTCFGLTSVNLPLVTHIGQRAFQLCTGLTLVNIPLATNIGERAFCRWDGASWRCPVTILICFDTAQIAIPNMSKENKANSVELSKTCKLIYDLTDNAVVWLRLRTRMRVSFNNVRIGNPALPAILFQFVFDTFETFKQLRTKVDSLPGPVKQIWKQYVNDKIKMYHEDITFLSGFTTGTEVGNWLRF